MWQRLAPYFKDNVAVAIFLQQIALALNGKVVSDYVRAPGPGHSAADDSLMVWPTDSGDDVIVKTFCPTDDRMACLRYVRGKLGISPKFKGVDLADLINDALNHQPAPSGKIVQTYPYIDEHGTLLYEQCRFEPKSFRQRRPDGNGGWIWKLNGGRRVIYRWPELIARPNATVFITEGEKDCDNVRALNFTATTVASGTWTDDCIQALAGRQCWIIQDVDKNGAGDKKALDAARLLHPVTASVKIVRLPGLTGDKGNKDVSDWLEQGHTKGELIGVCASAPDWVPSGRDIITARNTTPAVVAAQPAEPAIALSFFSDLANAKAKAWLIKGVIARGECSTWFAPPGKGKSALLTDIFMHGANSAEYWRGYRVKGKFGGIYFALERADLVKRRMAAHQLRDDLPLDLPIAVAGQVINLISRTCVDNIVDAVKRAEDRFGCQVGFLTFDTWAKAIAAGGGDESVAKDLNIALANLRRVVDRVPYVHIATIGHTGKDESRGERGSNAKKGDVDLEVQIGGDSVRSATVRKANDQPEGLLTSFRLEPFDFGLDEDGDPFRTYIVSNESIAGASGSRQSLSDKQRLALDALIEATLHHGVDLPPRDGMPGGLKSVTADQWFAELIRLRVIDPDRSNPRARFNELRTSFAARRLIGVDGEIVWRAFDQ